MNDYEKLRNEFISNCIGMDKDIMAKVLIKLDRTVSNYEITQKTTDIALRNEDGIPDVVRTYIACKGVSGQSKKTLENNLCILKNFFNDVGKSPENVEANDIRRWIWNYKQQKNIKTFAKAQEYMTMTRLRWSEVVVADGQCDDKLWYTKAKVDEVLLKHLPKDMQLDWDTRLDMSRHTIGFRFGPTKQEMIESGKYAELDARTKKES